MALGELIRSVELEYRTARQREAEFERLVEEKKAQLQEQAKRIAFKREANTAAAIRSAELAATAIAMEKEVQLRRESFRHYQVQIDALNVKIQLQQEQNAKDEERKLAERGELEKKLEANVNKYQAFPEAQKLANLELERNLLQKVTKLGKMKASNLEQGVGHGQGAFESTPEISTQKYQDFCTRFAEKSLTDGSPKIQYMETEAEDHNGHATNESTSPPVMEEGVSELDKEASAPAEFALNQSPTMNEDQNEVSEVEQDMQVDQVHTAPLDVDPEPVAEEPEQIEQVQQVAETIEQETVDVPPKHEEIPDKNNFNFTRPSSQNFAPSVKLPPVKIPTVNSLIPVFEKAPPAVRSNVPTVFKDMNFELPTSTRLKEPETAKEVTKEKPKEKAFGGFGSLFGSASPTRSEASVESEDEGFGFGAFGKPKKKAADKSEEKKNQGNVFGFGKQDDKKEKKKPSFFLDF